ncbi:PC-esterase domain-containing protein 1A-like isoform X2 [Phyllobates terribilis]|uniref:PC-esterase domain-containing protein 1A-like isoform X1 n=1 Tax=Phyllobates terribilis TaxID=111132 RepID=UPI003CCB3B3C
MGGFRSVDVRQLLHNKFVVVLGDSIQRSVYKDLVKFLQDDAFLSEDQLKKPPGEFTFENDSLIEGGQMNKLHNGTTYREVRQYRSGHHLVRFYFLTRVYSAYLESILSDFQSGPPPDVLIVNSCVWDVNRYNDQHLEGYKSNLDHLFLRLKEVLSPQCLIMWTMTMPVGYRESEIPEFHNIPHNLQTGIVEGNFFSATLANFHHLDVLDMHYHFRYDLRLRCRDGVHWNYLAHRKYTQILLTHIALAWGVEPPKQQMPEDSVRLTVPPSSAPCPKQQPARQEKELYSLGAAYMPGYTSFDGSEIRAVSGIQCPAYVTGEQLFSSDAVSPFVTDSPLLSANMTPGYFSPPPGPPPSSQYLPMMLLPANFGYFRPCDLFPPEAWKMRPPKRLKPGAGWRPPYRRPPIHPTGNY